MRRITPFVFVGLVAACGTSDATGPGNGDSPDGGPKIGPDGGIIIDPGGSDGGNGNKDGGVGVPGTGLFTNPMPWTTTVDTVAKSNESDTIIGALQSAGGWGTGTFRTDRSIEVLQAD